MKKNILIAIAILIMGGLAYWMFGISDYYEYKAQSAYECLEGELYNEDYNVCYFDYYCETDAECADVDKRYGELLNALADEYEQDDHEHAIYSGARSNTETVIEDVPEIETNSKLVELEVKEEKLENQVATEEKTLSTKKRPFTVQEMMSVLLPVKELSRIVKYKEDSDGRDGTLAYVEPANKTGNQWILAYDPKDTYDLSGNYMNINDLLTTLIHEYGHIVMLNNTQVKMVDANVEYVECANNESIINEGCAQSYSYIHQYIKKFWSEELREQSYQAQVKEEGGDFAFDLYNKNPNDFVTEYAATNEIEDMAESFALFVMKDRITNPTTKAEEKINFFYTYPEMISLRKHMRGGMIKILDTR